MPSINSDNLSFVRKARLLDLRELSAFTGIAQSSLEKFEDGSKEPTGKQIATLASALGIPSYQLSWNSRPNLEPLPQDFRRKNPRPANLSPRGLRAIYDSKNSSDFANQLILITDFQRATFDQDLDRSKSAKRIARQARTLFDEWFSERSERLNFSGDRAHVRLGALKLFFEVHGRLAQVNDAPSDDFFGFFITPENGIPSVFVNRSIQSKKSQLFTFSHEYCHYLLEEEGVSNPYTARNSIERACNKFAAEFLAPQRETIALVDELGPTARSDPDSLIRLVSARTFLSLHATAIRLKELDYIGQPDVNRWVKRFAGNFKQEKVDEAGEGQNWGPPHAKRISEIGHLPIYLASIAVERGDIDKFDVAESLKLSFKLQEKAFDLAKRRIEAAID